MAHEPDQLIGGIYEAAVEPTLWPSVLERMCDAVGRASAFVITTHDFVDPVDVWLARFDPSCVDRRFRKYARPEGNPGVRAYTTIPPLRVLPRTVFLSDRQFLDHPCAQDVIGCQGLFHSCIATLERDADLLSSFAVLRPKAAGDFETAEIDLLQRLVPHLARAQRVHRQTAAARLHRRQSERALDALDFGLILLAGDRRILFANQVATRLLQASDGLGQHQGRLRSCTNPALATLLANATGPHGPRVAGAACLSRRGGRRPLQIWAIPLPRERIATVHLEPRADIALMLIDPERQPQIRPALFRTLYGLTEAEARLACGLLAGQRLEDYGAQAGITINTARTQLKSVFAKTGTDRQAELVRLLAWSMYAPTTAPETSAPRDL